MLSLHNHGRNWWMFFFFQRCISYRISDFCFSVSDLLPWLQKSFMLELLSFPWLYFTYLLESISVSNVCLKYNYTMIKLAKHRMHKFMSVLILEFC
jgi:hypothetical protein